MSDTILDEPPQLLYVYEERAAILEYDAGMSRVDAEREAWVEVVPIIEKIDRISKEQEWKTH